MDNTKKVNMILKKLQNRGECHDMDIFINTSILLSACGKKQYFEVDYDVRVKGLVLYLLSHGCVVATMMTKDIETITVIEKGE